MTRKEVDKQTEPLSLDLTALFNVMRDDVIKNINDLKEESPETLLKKIEDLF